MKFHSSKGFFVAAVKAINVRCKYFSAYDQNLSNQWLGGPPVT